VIFFPALCVFRACFVSVDLSVCSHVFIDSCVDSVYLFISLSVSVSLSLSLSGRAGPSTQTLIDLGAKVTNLIQDGEVWRLFSAMFLHAGWLHLVGNLVVSIPLGIWLERYDVICCLVYVCVCVCVCVCVSVIPSNGGFLYCSFPVLCRFSAMCLSLLVGFAAVLSLVVHFLLHCFFPPSLASNFPMTLLFSFRYSIHGFIRMAIIYLVSGIAGNLASAVFYPDAVTVGASGAVFGLIGVVFVDTVRIPYSLELILSLSLSLFLCFLSLKSVFSILLPIFSLSLSLSLSLYSIPSRRPLFSFSLCILSLHTDWQLENHREAVAENGMPHLHDGRLDRSRSPSRRGQLCAYRWLADGHGNQYAGAA
jgi:membrane associated rhomboid family serine protease